MAKELVGAALLAAIASGEVTRISTKQAGTLDASHFAVNTADVVDNLAAVALTDAGKAAAGGSAPAASSGYAIDDGVPMPEARGRNQEGGYPFEKLVNVGQSFHVPKTAENPDPATRLSSSVSGARVKFSPLLTNDDGTPKMESYEVTVYKTDAEGHLIKENGSRVAIGKETKTRQARGEPTRDFRVVSVGSDDPRGEGARCFRIK